MTGTAVSAHNLLSTLLVVFDLGGTFVFALCGAGAAGASARSIRRPGTRFRSGQFRWDYTRCDDWSCPSAAISDWRYVAVSLLAGLITFFWYPLINRLTSPVLIFDAAGLGLFAVAGAEKAVAFHAAPIAATVLGMLTGIGGGVARDILVREIPTVLRTQLYAVAALAGAAFVVAGHELHLPSSVGAGLGAVICIGLRLSCSALWMAFPGGSDHG